MTKKHSITEKTSSLSRLLLLPTAQRISTAFFGSDFLSSPCPANNTFYTETVYRDQQLETVYVRPALVKSFIQRLTSCRVHLNHYTPNLSHSSMRSLLFYNIPTLRILVVRKPHVVVHTNRPNCSTNLTEANLDRCCTEALQILQDKEQNTWQLHLISPFRRVILEVSRFQIPFCNKNA